VVLLTIFCRASDARSDLRSCTKRRIAEKKHHRTNDDDGNPFSVLRFRLKYVNRQQNNRQRHQYPDGVVYIKHTKDAKGKVKTEVKAPKRVSKIQ